MENQVEFHASFGFEEPYIIWTNEILEYFNVSYHLIYFYKRLSVSFYVRKIGRSLFSGLITRTYSSIDGEHEFLRFRCHHLYQVLQKCFPANFHSESSHAARFYEKRQLRQVTDS